MHLCPLLSRRVKMSRQHQAAVNELWIKTKLAIELEMASSLHLWNSCNERREFALSRDTHFAVYPLEMSSGGFVSHVHFLRGSRGTHSGGQFFRQFRLFRRQAIELSHQIGRCRSLPLRIGDQDEHYGRSHACKLRKLPPDGQDDKLV